ncbi:MAG TPA: glycosyltransferase family 4 protein [Verrucomicrobiae bacterium]|nr:glycosyltransferase family 4 protein [Verrucomicrobiae bacterium]
MKALKIAISHANAAYMMGGSVVYVWALAKSLRERGHDVRIIAGECDAPERHFENVPLELFPFRRRERFPKWGTRFRKLMERLSFGWNTRQYLLEQKCDVLNIHKPYDLPMAAWVKKRTGCKVVWRCHGRDYFATLQHWLKYADAIYCVSDFARRDLIEHYPVNAEVIYTGVDTEFFRPAGGSQQTSPPMVLYFGRLEGWKGVRYLVEAFGQLGDTNFRGRIVGEGPENENLARMLGELKLGAKVELEPSLRTREGIRTLVESADIVVFPPVAVETMSNAMLEAMAMAKAIVATQVGCFVEVLKQGETAILVEPRNASALASGIRALLDAPDRRLSIGKAARADAVARFDAQASFDRVEQLFRRICQ